EHAREEQFAVLLDHAGNAQALDDVRADSDDVHASRGQVAQIGCSLPILAKRPQSCTIRIDSPILHPGDRAVDLLDDLTAAQQEAVTHFEGPLPILAGPGSGKTRVITRRVAWLLQQGVRPANILAITFTNKAAGEMRQRVETLVPNSRVWISTFHALGARLLRQYGDRLNLDTHFPTHYHPDPP